MYISAWRESMIELIKITIGFMNTLECFHWLDHAYMIYIGTYPSYSIIVPFRLLSYLPCILYFDQDTLTKISSK